MCGLLGAGGKFIGRRLQTKARKHDQIRVLAVKDKHHRRPISTALTDDKISDEEFRLILSEVDKYDRMKAEIRRHQTQGLSEHKKGASPACERRSDDDSPYQAVGRAPSSWRQCHLLINISCSRV